MKKNRNKLIIVFTMLVLVLQLAFLIFGNLTIRKYHNLILNFI